MTTLLAPLLLAAFAQEPAPPPPAALEYLPEKSATLLRAFICDGDIEAEPLRKALDALAQPGVPSMVVAGPLSCSAKPKARVIVVETARTADSRAVAKAVRAGAQNARPLAWTVFDAIDPPRQGFMGMGMVDFVVGMSGDIGWYEPSEDEATFLTKLKKPGAKDLAKRWASLTQPFGGKPLGALTLDRFAWQVRAPDAKSLRAACVALKRVAGVAEFAVEPAETLGLEPWVAERTLSFAVRLEDLEAVAGLAAGASPEQPGLRPQFDTGPLLDEIAHAGLEFVLPDPDADAEPDPDPAPPPPPPPQPK